MEQSVYKIGEVSTRLGLADKNNNTLRSWVEEFGEFLSALANPAAGQPRRFTPRDVQVLTAIRDYRANHLSFEEIRERLCAGEHDVTPPGPREAPSIGNGIGAQDAGQGSQALMPVAQLEALLAPLAASADEWRRLAEEYRQRLEGREARIETLERRVEDLYARLDTTLQGRVPAPLTPPDAMAPAPYATAEVERPEPYATAETEALAPRVVNGSLPVTSTNAPSADNGNGPGPGQASQDAMTAAPGNDGNAIGHGAQGRDAETALFPLPVVDHRAGAGTTGTGALEDRGSGMPRVEGASRRRWWRPWA